MLVFINILSLVDLVRIRRREMINDGINLVWIGLIRRRRWGRWVLHGTWIRNNNRSIRPEILLLLSSNRIRVIIVCWNLRIRIANNSRRRCQQFFLRFMNFDCCYFFIGWVQMILSIFFSSMMARSTLKTSIAPFQIAISQFTTPIQMVFFKYSVLPFPFTFFRIF